MTLIITVINKRSTIQVSDRRLTYITSGILADDNAYKAICVINQDGSFSIAFTGLAEVISKGRLIRTDEWLAEFLAETDAGNKPLRENLALIENHATTTFNQLKLNTDKKGTTFAITGYQNGNPFLGCISNTEDENGNAIPTKNSFSSWIKFPILKDDNKCIFMVNGLEDVLDETFWPKIERNGKEIANKQTEEVVEELVLMIRWAAHHKMLGKYIGQDCMSAVISVEGNFVTQYHSLDLKSQSYSPHLIVPGMAFKKIEIWKGKKPPWWTD